MNRPMEIGLIVAAFVVGILVGYLLAGLTASPTRVSACPSTSNTTTVSSPGLTGGFIPTGGPTGPGYDNNNTYGYAFMMPTTVVSSNPWGGNTGNFSLLNAIAIRYGVLTTVVWFYYPPNGMGTLVGFQDSPINSSAPNNTPFIYVGTNGSLFAGDWLYYAPPPQVVSNELSTGWHMVVVEEYASGGKFYLNLYLDGKYIGTADLFYPSQTILPQLFGAAPNGGPGTYPFGYIGTCENNWPAGNGKDFFFNGTIAVVALYDELLPASTIAQMWAESQVTSAGISAYLPRGGLVVVYVMSPSLFSPTSGQLRPYYANATALGQLGISNPDLLLVSYGQGLRNGIWASYGISVKVS